jgi:hypothetical protein
MTDPGVMSEAEAAAFDAKDRETWARSAANIIASKDVLSLFARDISKAIAGEQQIAQLLYLSLQADYSASA